MKSLFPERYRGVMVCLSGGLDSTALFHALWPLSKAENFFALGVFHMHYGLRGDDSDADFRFAKALAEEHGVPFFSRVVSEAERVTRQGESLQEWARRLRHEEFARFAADGWVLATAHHADDLAENVLLRLIRGAGPQGWLGMETWRPPYWKPLLDVKKTTLAAFLAKQGKTHRVDESNASRAYKRNVVRHDVLPLLEAIHPGAGDRLIQAAEEASELAGWLEERLAQELGDPPSVERLARLPNGVARHALARFLSRDGEHRQLSRRFLDLVLAAVRTRQTSATWDLPGQGGSRLVLAAGHLRIDTAVAPKSSRQSQHRRALTAPLPDLVLEPGSHASIRHSAGLSAFPADPGRPNP